MCSRTRLAILFGNTQLAPVVLGVFRFVRVRLDSATEMCKAILVPKKVLKFPSNFLKFESNFPKFPLNFPKFPPNFPKFPLSFPKFPPTGWGLDSKLAYKSHMGPSAAHEDEDEDEEEEEEDEDEDEDEEKDEEFPLPGADEPLACPIVAFYGKEDPAVTLDMVSEWRGLSGNPESFEVVTMDGGHLWFQNSSSRCEALALELDKRMKRHP
ncbi:unnamed protein product [Polarella glacialis]|uniref:Uncharacterized protein n=1 Tax=Polarella glacialis TaxID=89957 RepID=A0A813D302_POLGL|nr:unnamed protein product [Polarella glacialis]